MRHEIPVFGTVFGLVTVSSPMAKFGSDFIGDWAIFLAQNVRATQNLPVFVFLSGLGVAGHSLNS
jgi:hypothetical protein